MAEQKIHPTKKRVLKHIKDHPGLRVADIVAGCKISLGSANYHVQQLEREGLIHSNPDGASKRFFAKDKDNGQKEMRVISTLRRPVPLAIVQILLKEGQGTNGSLAKEIGVSEMAIIFHMRRLKKLGIMRHIKNHPKRFHYTLKNRELVEKALKAMGAQNQQAP